MSSEHNFLSANMIPYEDSEFVSIHTLKKEITLASSLLVLGRAHTKRYIARC